MAELKNTLDKITRTEEFLSYWRQAHYVQALSVLHTFKAGFTKEEREIIKIAHEMNSMEDFYKVLGYNKADLAVRVHEIVNRVYKKKLG